MKRLFILLAFIIISLALTITAISIYLQPNDLAACGSVPSYTGACRPADAIVAVSGGDTNARTDKAITLYKAGWAPLLIFSGAAQDKSGPSNAQVMEARAIAAGVPSSAIQLDENATTTQQNATNTDVIFRQDRVSRIILVTSGYHQRRASLDFSKRAAGVQIVNAPTDDKDWNAYWWTRGRGWWLAGSELVKIGIFYMTGGND